MLTPEEIAHFATIPANGDREISNIIFDGNTKIPESVLTS